MIGTMELVLLKVLQWEQREGFIHGFLGRKGGKSQGTYDSLNLSLRVGDDPLMVKDNLCDVKKAVGVHDLRIVTMHQIHGDRIVEIKDKNLKEAGEADGEAGAGGEVEGVEEGGGVAALEEGIEEAGEPLEGGGGHEEGVAEGVRGVRSLRRPWLSLARAPFFTIVCL